MRVIHPIEHVLWCRGGNGLASPPVTTRTRPSGLRRGTVVALACLAIAAACSSGDADGGEGADAGEDAAAEESAASPEVVFPGDAWDRADAAALGFDQARLDAIAAQAEQAGSNCLLVTRHGQIAAEWYWNGTDASTSQEVFSVTKSHTSTLVGIAQAQGDLDLDDKASEYIDAWVGTDSEDVTIANLVSNDSGREWSLALDYLQLPGQPDLDAFATGLSQVAAPGETWAYNNAAIQTLDVVLREATGTDVVDFAAENLYEPIRMDDTRMTTDGAGNTRTFMGVQSTCEDLARFGYLFLRGGEWDGTQVVPQDWVEAAVGQPSQDINDAYGYLWWLNRPGTVLGALQATTAADQPAGAPNAQTQLVPSAPEDMFFALGLGDQIVAVDPGSETVVVRLGGPSAPAGATPFDTASAAAVVTDALTAGR
jgi:CubicO group peptidase (beta-lactamase class C family)